MKKMIKMVAGMLVTVGILTVGASAATTNNAAGTGTAYAAGLRTPVVLEGTVDFATYNCAAFDVVKVCNIPANFFVQLVTAECVTTNTGTASAFVVGDSAATNTYLSTAISMVLPDAAITECTNAYRTAGGHLYTSADFISVVPTVAITDGKATIRVVGVKVGP
jgi:hypothetical protein